jgi:hypothetical protein
MVFMAVLIPVAVEAVLVAHRLASAADRRAVAAQLADNRLHRLVVEQAWSTGGTEGDFGEEWPAYRWELAAQDWPEDELTLLTLTVLYDVQGREQVVRLSTLVDEPLQ